MFIVKCYNNLIIKTLKKLDIKKLKNIVKPLKK